MIPILFPTYFEYTSEDIDRCVALSLGETEITEDDLIRYDKNGDGLITNIDVITIRNIVNSGASFETYGIGTLSDALSCRVTTELNGQYELVMQYPITGAYFNEIALRAVIKAKPDRISEPQAFRIYRITKPLNGVITVYARHIAYDLAGFAVSPFTAATLQQAMTAIPENATPSCPFNFESDMTSETEFSVTVPTNIWPLMGAEEGGLLYTYGGEYEFDNYDIHLRSRRGTDRGVSIRYGKNMTDLEQDANIANCFTGVYPYWTKTKDEETIFVSLTEKVVNAEGDFGYTKILALDLSGEFDEAPTQDQLREAAEKYMADNDIGTPVVSWKVEFLQLEQSAEFEGQALFESVFLGDDVSVEFEKLGISAKARAVKIVFDVLLDRYESVELGSVKSSLADTIISQGKEIDKKPTATLVQQIAAALTSAMMGIDGGAVRVLDTNGDDYPDTLYIADDPDPAKAVKVWRFNYEGWAASKNGYNGPFVLGATLDDGLLANFVTAANLVAGTIRSADEKTFLLELDNGTIFTAYETVYPVAEYSEDDLTRVISIILGDIEPTEEDFAKYDFYRDGKITNTDLIGLRNMLNAGADHVVSWKVSLDPTNNTNILRIWRESTIGANDTLITELFNVGIGGGRLMLGDPVEDTDAISKGYMENSLAAEMQTVGAKPQYVSDSNYAITTSDAGKKLSFAYTIRNEAITVTLEQSVSVNMPVGAEVAIVRSWGAAVTIQTSGIRLGLPGTLSDGTGGLTTTDAQSFAISKPFGTVILKKIENNDTGDVWIVQGDVDTSLTNSQGEITVEANTPINISLRDGEILDFAYVCGELASTATNVLMTVNEVEPDVSAYTYTGSGATTRGGIITLSASSTRATFVGTLTRVGERVLLEGSGLRGNGTGIGWANATWVVSGNVTSIGFSIGGMISYKKR